MLHQNAFTLFYLNAALVLSFVIVIIWLVATMEIGAYSTTAPIIDASDVEKIPHWHDVMHNILMAMSKLDSIHKPSRLQQLHKHSCCLFMFTKALRVQIVPQFQIQKIIKLCAQFLLQEKLRSADQK